MARHYFTHSFGIDNGGDTSNLPPVEGMSIVVEGMYLSMIPQGGTIHGPGTFTAKGLRGVPGTVATEIDPGFYIAASATEVVHNDFPVRGRTNEGGGLTFALTATSPDSLAGWAVVWGYYTDE